MGGGNLCIDMLGGGPEGGGRGPETKPGGGPAGGSKGPGTAELDPAHQPCSHTIRLHSVALVSKEFEPDDLPPIEIYKDTGLLVSLWSG